MIGDGSFWNSVKPYFFLSIGLFIVLFLVPLIVEIDETVDFRTDYLVSCPSLNVTDVCDEFRNLRSGVLVSGCVSGREFVCDELVAEVVHFD